VTTRTRAAIFLEAGKPMVVDEIELPAPLASQVLIKQFASGVCHSQLHELDRPNPALPIILGHESTGVVVAAGSAVSHVKEGDHVMVTWVPRHAGGPAPVPAKMSYRGQNIGFGAPAYTGTFTWAEDVIADQSMVVPLDADVDTGATSIIGCAVMTGVGAAIHAAQVHPGNSVAVFGAGGVGLSVIAGCAAVGAYPIIAIDLAEDKLAFAREFGATHGINAATGEPVAAIREMMGSAPGSGVDFAFDAIGAKVTMEQILAAARARRPGEREGGVAVLVGVPHGEPPTLTMGMLFGGKVYRGAPGGCSTPDRDFPMLVRWFREGKLPLDRMVTRRYRLDQINEACDDLRHGRIAGRAILEF
jgi:Zn-dependent alcohol dehydrogenase